MASAQRAAVHDRSAPRALPAVDARPEPTQHPDAEPVVAPKSKSARCPYCAATYDLGEPRGGLIDYYPDGERLYWGHCLTDRHQAVMRAMHANIVEQLNALPQALADGKASQTPTHRALRRLLA